MNIGKKMNIGNIIEENQRLQARYGKIIAKIEELAEDYSMCDGGHHKQYALLKILKIIKGDDYKGWVRTNEPEEGTPG